MKTAQEKVANWMATYGQDVPSKPGIPSLETRRLRAKLIWEESLETVVALGFRPVISGDKWEVEEYGTPDLVGIADGCADLHVVTLGTEVACGLNAEANFNEVMRSNDSKMWSAKEIDAACTARDGDGFYLDQDWSTKEAEIQNEDAKVYVVKRKSDGKVLKSPSYEPANLQPIIEGAVN